jgi:hypothetical protein
MIVHGLWLIILQHQHLLLLLPLLLVVVVIVLTNVVFVRQTLGDAKVNSSQVVQVFLRPIQ